MARRKKNIGIDKKRRYLSKKPFQGNDGGGPSYEKNIGRIAKRLKNILSPDVLNRLARETKLIERKKKYHAYEMFWSLIGGFAVGQATEIAGMLRAFVKDTGIRLRYGAWYKRLQKPAFAQFMHRAYEHMMDHLYNEWLSLDGPGLNSFSDILIQDGSSYAVNDLLQKHYPGRFTKVSPAAVEIHMLYSLRYGAAQSVGVAPDCVSEYEFMPTDKDAPLLNALCLFDRGYGSLERLHKIEQAQGFFVTRMKNNINPRITAVHHGNPRLRGQNLQSFRFKAKKDYDLSVKFNNDNTFEHLRVIALWNPQTRAHVLLLTNTRPERFPGATIGQLYRLRWQVELLFKELKSHTELRKFMTSNQNIAEGFIWAALCALLIRRFLLSSAQNLVQDNQRLSFHKAAISARTFMPDFIHCALHKFQQLEQCLIKILKYLQQVMTFSNPRKPSASYLQGALA